MRNPTGHHHLWLAALGLMTLTACGTVGPPIPPEAVGIAAKVAKERAAQSSQTKKDPQRPSLADEEVSLPPLQPSF